MWRMEDVLIEALLLAQRPAAGEGARSSASLAAHRSPNEPGAWRIAAAMEYLESRLGEPGRRPGELLVVDAATACGMFHLSAVSRGASKRITGDPPRKCPRWDVTPCRLAQDDGGVRAVGRALRRPVAQLRQTSMNVSAVSRGFMSSTSWLPAMPMTRKVPRRFDSRGFRPHSPWVMSLSS